MLEEGRVAVALTAASTESVSRYMPSSLEDTELRLGLAVNLDGCFERLVLSYQGRLYAFALRISGNHQDAEEIAQDAFVHAYRALAGYDRTKIEALAIRPWLYQIVLNVFRNRVRGHKLKVVPLDELGRDSTTEPSDSEREQPESVFERGERTRELSAILAALPERYRVAVVLRHVEGFGYGEAAALLGQPVGTVKSNVHRGVELLRKALSGVLQEPE